ncbi:cytosolic protein [Nonlabens sp. YIK11]|uniref:bacillithiol system redox-active protein YtxJ n=1 Tax=Nonlabens sp. YIK11 TaxID=1453349 RepID=UPI0006DCE72B|nr:bacillithiol system redox-active protein YtxJ [Nonlabens sp. YIK11]KQC33510.1 cytosolic protein [Nonlabens sp. YIK11]
MGLMDKLFKSQRDIAKDEIKDIQWEPLESVDQLHNLVKNSNLKTKVIFKHSTRCGISRMALSNFERNYENLDQNVTYYLLDLLNFREVSNSIAEELKVQHQSPQVIVLKDEKIIHTESHHGIDIKKIQSLIK